MRHTTCDYEQHYTRACDTIASHMLTKLVRKRFKEYLQVKRWLQFYPQSDDHFLKISINYAGKSFFHHICTDFNQLGFLYVSASSDQYSTDSMDVQLYISDTDSEL